MTLAPAVLLQFKGDEDFVFNITRNTPRYVRHFEDAADRLMPASTTYRRDADIFDFLQSQRLQQLQQVAQEGAEVVSDTPLSLVRRFEISIIPATSSKPRKLREIKAMGKTSAPGLPLLILLPRTLRIIDI